MVCAVGFHLFQTRYKHIHVGSATPVQGVDGLKQVKANSADLASCYGSMFPADPRALRRWRACQVRRSQTVDGMDAIDEPTRMYSRRV